MAILRLIKAGAFINLLGKLDLLFAEHCIDTLLNTVLLRNINGFVVSISRGGGLPILPTEPLVFLLVSPNHPLRSHVL